RREYLVALLFQEVGDAPPAPAAVPGAVHQHEGLGLTGLRQRRRAAQRRRAGAGTGAREHRAASEGWVIGCSHRFLLAIFCWRILAPARGSVPSSAVMPLPGNLINRILIDRIVVLSPMHGVGKARARGRVACRTACPPVPNAMRGRMGRLALPTVAGA